MVILDPIKLQILAITDSLSILPTGLEAIEPHLVIRIA